MKEKMKEDKENPFLEVCAVRLEEFSIRSTEICGSKIIQEQRYNYIRNFPKQPTKWFSQVLFKVLYPFRIAPDIA